MEFFLAIEAKDADAECWLADEHEVLARGEGVAVLPDLDWKDGTPHAADRLRNLLQETGSRAGVPLDAVGRTCVVLPEAMRPERRRWMETALAELVTGKVIVGSEEDMALEAAFDKGPGALVSVSEGSRVLGRCADGMLMTAGGWGPVLGDEGSAHWIGLQAIRSALRARDRGVQSPLLKAIQEHYGVDTVSALLAKANQQPMAALSALAEVVSGLAAKGDALATSVLQRAGEELAGQTGVVFSKMLAAGCAPADTHRVAATGALWAKAPGVLEQMRTALKRLHPDTAVDPEPVRAIAGALLRARRG